MIMLSSVIARAYCPAAVTPHPDRFFAVGCQAVGAFWIPEDAQDSFRIASQARTIMSTDRSPWDPDGEQQGVFNDLFSPRRSTEGGKLIVWVPVAIEEAISSTLISRDWRFIGLAWWAAKVVKADQDAPVVIVACDAAGRTVAADTTAGELYDAINVALRISGPEMRPGPACRSCSKARICPELRHYVDDFGSAPGGGDSVIRATRLYSERAAVSMRLEVLEAKRDELDAELEKLVKNGKLRLNDELSIDVPNRIMNVYDFSAVRKTLMAHGYWDDSVGSIRVAELQKLIKKLPDAVRQEIECARSERTTKPSLSEAVRHGRFST